MRKFFINTIRRGFLFAALTATMSGAWAHTDAKTAPMQIKAVIGKTFDKPGNVVDTSPVVVVDNYAVAGWTQAKMGGRALLRLNKGAWEIIACGGEDFKKLGGLKLAGVAEPTAIKLVAQIEKAEQSVSPERIKRFDSFGPPVDLKSTGSHAAPHHKH
ncbi:MAG: copper uptake system-associated protein [Polaromonas sp.]